ncbi:hypothetical protein CSC02_3278 [Enterobacter hormaechei subsp. hoffmannii]|nr:hypothetical protein CSC02_3278 [Enterobacter hormaechei subsp. hoffmannii]
MVYQLYQEYFLSFRLKSGIYHTFTRRMFLDSILNYQMNNIQHH